MQHCCQPCCFKFERILNSRPAVRMTPSEQALNVGCYYFQFMKQFILIIVILFTLHLLHGQTHYQLVGTWNLQYSLQPNKDSCNLPKEIGTLVFSANGMYSWITNGDTIEGKWKVMTNKIKLYNNRAVNFEGTVADLLYPIDFKKEFLIVHQPEGGDISCPHLYFKRKK